MEFALLASGSQGNCFVLRDDETVIMIDCGSTKKHLLASFEKIHLQFSDIDALLVTHDHTDHVSQLRHFLHQDIYSPIDLPDAEVFTVRPNRSFVIGSVQITPIALSHDALNTTGYILENGFEKFVYITDTGYVNQKYMPLLKGADYIVMESNHDTAMLMRTSRPQYVKSRIISDQGHLSNEDCAGVLNAIITEKTKMIILAHISRQGNTREKALEVNRNYILENHDGPLHKDLVLCAAGQHEMIRKGFDDEERDLGTVSCRLGMEYLADTKGI